MSNLRDFYSSGSTVAGGGVTWSIETADMTTVAGEGYLMDCSSAAKTVTLHNPPSVGDTVSIGDLYGNFATNNCTIDSNTLKIMGTVQNLTLDVKNQRITLVYTGATQGWDIVELEPSPLQTPYDRTVAGLNLTGNVLGFDVTKTGANQLTVTKGWVLDSTGQIPLAMTADTAVSIPSAVNTIYHLFVCRLVSDGSITIKQYTSEAGAVSDGTINAYRWIGYWVTNGSSNCRSGIIKDGELWWERFAENTINSSTTPPAGITTAISLTTFLPVSRVISVIYSGITATSPQPVAMSGISGTCEGVVQGTSLYSSANQIYENGTGLEKFIPLVDGNVYWGLGGSGVNANIQLGIHACKLRR